MKDAILIVPCCEKGRGGGHITRCVKLTNELRASGKEAYLYIPANESKIINFLQTSQFDKSLIISENAISKKKWELVILDRYKTPQNELDRWIKLAPVIGLDEGGHFRDCFDILVDILIPENFKKPSANITSCGLLDLPKKTKTALDANNKKIKILISFGQEDSANLAVRTVKKLSKKYFNGTEITLIKGGLNTSKYKIPDSVKVLDSTPNLADHLYEYDLVITHYGITAYEALYAGTEVLLDHPTSYHKKLAKAAGFTDIKKIKKILNSISNPKKNKQRFTLVRVVRGKIQTYWTDPCSWSKNNETSLANLVSSFSPQVNHSCPVCENKAYNRSIARFPDRTYRHCSKCGAIYMDTTHPPAVKYEREYFFDSYKKQYGKTYLEDFPNLAAMAKRRLKNISHIFAQKNFGLPAGVAQDREKTLLDIGCAYGPFLSAAKDAGFSPLGLEPAQDAVRYVQKNLSLPAVQGFFPNCPLPAPSIYDAVTLWYVIEHFRDCSVILTEVKKLLKPGGILAFSTPSSSGISGRKSFRKYLEKSPADHFTIWSPKMCGKALAFAGFKVEKTVVTGHHPERFPLLGKLAKSRKSPLYWLFFALSKFFRLGDTFEVYARLV
jgi:spore coat polysaccharide biosynthesis predicted glycosyltransferase SpsG/2-polyprenyl-3-methyl-5-hydroxy-6-metoxy-1,4-benzoquinol methylase